MSQSSEEKIPTVRQTTLKPWLLYENLSPLGRELMDIAKSIEMSDEREMSEDDIERELILRRGGGFHP